MGDLTVPELLGAAFTPFVRCSWASFQSQYNPQEGATYTAMVQEALSGGTCLVQEALSGGTCLVQEVRGAPQSWHLRYLAFLLQALTLQGP